MSTQVLVVANPRSGGGRGEQKARVLCAALGEHGLEPAVRHTVPGPDPGLDQAILESPKVVAVGGDGTLNRVIRPIVLSDGAAPPVAYLPAGTANVAARAFALPRDPAGVARLVAAGTTRAVDAGIATDATGERTAFLLWLGAGVDAALIEAVAARRHTARGMGVIMQYLREAVRLAVEYGHPEIDVRSAPATGRFGAAMIANIGPLAVGSITRHADPGDGSFDLIATRPRGGLGWGLALLLGALGLYDRVPDVVRVRVTEARFGSAARVPIQVDGEPWGTMPVEVRIRPGRVRLLSPQAAAGIRAAPR